MSSSRNSATIGRRLAVLSIAFVAILLVPTWLLRGELVEIDEIGASVHVTGHQLVDTQELGKAAQAFVLGGDAGYGEQLSAVAARFDEHLDVLENGDAEHGVRALWTADQRAAFQRVTEQWGPLRAAVGEIMDPAADDAARRAALATLMAGERRLFEASDELAEHFEELVASSTARAQWLMKAVLGVVISYLVVSWIIVQRGVVGPLTDVVRGLSEVSRSALSGATGVREDSSALAASVTESAASLEQTAASLEEMSSITRSNAENASKANAIATRSKASSTEGAELVDELERSMEAMCASSAEMGKIVKNIEAIAFQTNLLALNAAVEAARAGEHGKGFAVVAEEVRSLAQRAAEATRSTATLIDDSHVRTTAGLESTQRVAESLCQIRTGAEELASLVQEISSAGSEISEGIGQINTAVSQLDQVTQANSISAESSAESADRIFDEVQSLDRIRRGLSELVGIDEFDTTKAADPSHERPARRSSRTGLVAPAATNAKSTLEGPSAPLPGAPATDPAEAFLPLADGKFEEF